MFVLFRAPVMLVCTKCSSKEAVRAVVKTLLKGDSIGTVLCGTYQGALRPYGKSFGHGCYDPYLDILLWLLLSSTLAPAKFHISKSC